MPFSGPKWPICHEQIFLVQPLSLLSSTYWLFLSCKILKSSYSRSRVMKMCHFLGPKWSTCPKHFFFWKIINIILIYLLAPSIGQNLKKNSSCGSRVIRMCNFWAQNGQFPQMRNFFRKPVNKPCFFHSCLSTYQKSKSYINLLMPY